MHPLQTPSPLVLLTKTVERQAPEAPVLDSAAVISTLLASLADPPPSSGARPPGRGELLWQAADSAHMPTLQALQDSTIAELRRALLD